MNSATFLHPNHRLAILVSAVCLFCSPQSARAADLGFLAKDGVATADIVTAEKPTRAASLAAKELQKYLRKISGAEFSIGTKPNSDFSNHVFVGPGHFATEHGVTDRGLRKDMFRIVSGKGFLALVGKDKDFKSYPAEAEFTWDNKDPAKSWESGPQRKWEEITNESWVSPMSLFSFRPNRFYSKTLDISLADEVGTLYAVNEFIRSLGVEWYMARPTGEIIPESKTIAIPEVDEMVKPAFARRQIAFTAPRFDGTRQVNDMLWYYRLGLGQDFPKMLMHTFQLLHGHPDAVEKYPEYFAKYKGKSGADLGKYGQATVSSPEFKEAMVRYARAYFDTYTWAEGFSVAPTDGYWRLADQDLDKVTPERGYHGAMSDLIWEFVNDVAREVKKTHPDKKIVGLAYSTYRLPPEKIDKLEDNVEVFICWPARRHLGADARARVDMLREGWEKIAAPGNLNAWDYYLHSYLKRHTSGVPMIYPRLMAADVKAVDGVYAAEFVGATRYSTAARESSDETGLLMPGINHLKTFITARSYWNPDMDIEKVLSGYYRDFFGPAETQMREFNETAESGPWESWTPEQISRLQALLKKGQGVAGDTVYGWRIEMIDIETTKKLAELLKKRTRGYEMTLPMVEFDKEPTEFTVPIDRKFRGKFSKLRLSDPLGNPGARSPYRAEIGFGVTPKYFYIFAQSESPKAHPSALEKDDPTIVNDDAVRFIIETDRETEYLVAVNSSGTLLDARVSGEDGLDSSWDSGAEVAVAPTETGWDAVIRIPLDRLGGTGPSKENYWRFNAARHLPEVDPISADTVLVTNGTNDIDSLQNSARLIPGARTEIFEEDNVEDGQF